jgi:hypothetical protein
MDDRERRWSRGRVVLVLAVVAVGGYLAVARWKAVRPGPNAPRVQGPAFDLMWWR